MSKIIDGIKFAIAMAIAMVAALILIALEAANALVQYVKQRMRERHQV